jgi:hypothetical protein
LQQKEREEGRMGPPKDRLAAMQANAYFDDDDSFNIPVDEEQEGKPWDKDSQAQAVVRI